MLDCRTATRLVVTFHAVLSISGLQLQAASKGALLSFNWPGEPGAARWHLGDEVTVEAEETFGKNQVRPFKETRYLRCGVPEDTSVSSSAILKRIKVKPDTGYTAQVRVNYYGGSALTFGILKVSSGDFDPGAYHDSFVERIARELYDHGLEFFAVRDSHGTYTGGKWTEVTLPFQTEAQMTEIGIYVGRRYGSWPILFDAVQLTEGDSVGTGDMTPSPNPFPAATDKEKERGFIVSRQHWMQPVFPLYYPTRDEVIDTVDCWLSLGEYIPATFSLTALRDLKNVRVRIADDLEGKQGDRLPGGAVEVGTVRNITRWITNRAPVSPGKSYERRPLFIVPNEPVDIKDRETQAWWLTVHSGDNQAPGKYRGEILIQAEGVPEYVLSLNVEVLPIKLAVPEVTYGFWYRHEKQRTEFQNEQFFRRALEDMKVHGMNSFSVYTDVERRNPDGTYTIDLDYTRGARYSLNRQMEMIKNSGLVQGGHPLLLLAHGIGDGSFANGEKTVAAIVDRGRDAGWPEFLFYAVDEPGVEHAEQINKLTGVIRRVPGVRTVTAGVRGGLLAQYYDVLMPHDPVPKDMVEECRKTSSEPWVYNCNMNGANPVWNRYYAGYYAWTEQLKGNFLWCYTESGSRMTDTGKITLAVPHYGNPLLFDWVIPSSRGPIATLGWEARREGVDDYRYLQTLREAIADAQSSKDPDKIRLARTAQRFLREAEKTLKAPDYRGKGMLNPTSNAPLKYEDPFSLNLHPGLELGDYDRIRREAADWILLL